MFLGAFMKSRPVIEIGSLLDVALSQKLREVKLLCVSAGLGLRVPAIFQRQNAEARTDPFSGERA